MKDFFGANEIPIGANNYMLFGLPRDVQAFFAMWTFIPHSNVICFSAVDKRMQINLSN